MPVMPRTKEAQKISDKLMKKPKPEKDAKLRVKRDGESDFDKQIRTMIKR